MDIKSREFFPNNKITEAICQFTFKTALDSNLFDEFSKVIISSGRYAKSEKIPAFHFNINLNDVTPTKIETNSLKFSNDLGDKIVQVFPNNISIHQVGNYKTWELFIDDVNFIINQFNRYFENSFSRFDLRTINVFDFKIDENPNDYFNININSPYIPNENVNFNFTIEQVYEQNKSFGVIRVDCIRQPESRKFVLDLSSVLLVGDDPIKLQDSTKVKGVLDDSHVKLYKMFTEVINDNIKKIIR
jgi:uncharacterized protein (TIGR04255 family)